MIRRTLMFAAMALAMQGAWPRTGTASALQPRAPTLRSTRSTPAAPCRVSTWTSRTRCAGDEGQVHLGEAGMGRHDPGAAEPQVRRHLGLDVDHRRAQRSASISPTSTTRPLGLVSKKGSGLVPELDVLKGKRIGVQRGTVADTFATRFWAEQGITVVRYARQKAYLDLSAGRIDAAWAWLRWWPTAASSSSPPGPTTSSVAVFTMAATPTRRGCDR